MFADGAPASRYAAPIATATEWLRREER
jgi:hypothetical protein